MKQVSVVIPVFGRENVFESLEVLQGSAYFDCLKIIIVDNGNAVALHDRLLSVRSSSVEVVSLPENMGGSGGYIAGVEHAMKHHPESKYIWLLDDDAKPNDGTLPGLIDSFEYLKCKGIENVACMGSAVLNMLDPELISECGADFSMWKWKVFCRKAGEKMSGQDGIPHIVEYCSGCSVLIPREVIDKNWILGECFHPL